MRVVLLMLLIGCAGQNPPNVVTEKMIDTMKSMRNPVCRQVGSYLYCNEQQTMSNVFYYKMTINPMMFNQMMREEDVKDHYKNRLAFELAKQLVETNRTKFSYTKDTIKDEYTLKGEVTL